ncbi:MAG: TetM/TetW/TetO/TetS family tetracycline resistance ribosomal protection protein, partial [Clostridia bacterium]|nr:TetM/TetW/TetO/TetS family tetracycline resistance ribosomal protection protein [Clostridia bacterium]
GLGFEKSEDSILTPVLDYRLNLPEGENVYEAYLKLRPLIEEEPSLNISYDPALKEIRVSLMGEIQLEVFERLIFERFGIKASFGEGAILYKETVKDAVFGAGHFEPLRHYAEVHLLIEPLPRGSGIVAATDCSLDALARGWQRLVLTHIEEKLHRGVLTGSPITDVRITLVAGKAHIKHTEGGDFRQATYRAVRQALMKAESVLLEPSFNFRIEVPSEHLGRVLTDVFAMKGETNQPENDGITATVSGVCPVATMRGYAKEIRAYTRGEGKITLAVGDYIPCHNSDEVIEKIGYNPMLDERNTPNSVFCKAGSGYVVPWDEADALMHVRREDCSEDAIIAEKAVRQRVERYTGTVEEDKELMRIFESTYGKIKPRRFNEKTENAAKEVKEPSQKPKKAKPKGEDYLLIDGYNFIFAADSLRALAERDISLARDTVTRIMCDYSAFKRCKVMIVFDAYRRRGGEGSVEELGEVSVVYTKESETADAFIERTTHALAKEHTVRVVTQDMQEQFVVLGSGGLRVSAKEFLAELKITEKEIKETIESFK